MDKKQEKMALKPNLQFLCRKKRQQPSVCSSSSSKSSQKQAIPPEKRTPTQSEEPTIAHDLRQKQKVHPYLFYPVYAMPVEENEKNQKQRIGRSRQDKSCAQQNSTQSQTCNRKQRDKQQVSESSNKSSSNQVSVNEKKTDVRNCCKNKNILEKIESKLSKLAAVFHDRKKSSKDCSCNEAIMAANHFTETSQQYLYQMAEADLMCKSAQVSQDKMTDNNCGNTVAVNLEKPAKLDFTVSTSTEGASVIQKCEANINPQTLVLRQGLSPCIITKSETMSNQKTSNSSGQCTKSDYKQNNKSEAICDEQILEQSATSMKRSNSPFPTKANVPVKSTETDNCTTTKYSVQSCNQASQKFSDQIQQSTSKELPTSKDVQNTIAKVTTARQKFQETSTKNYDESVKKQKQKIFNPNENADCSKELSEVEPLQQSSFKGFSGITEVNQRQSTGATASEPTKLIRSRKILNRPCASEVEAVEIPKFSDDSLIFSPQQSTLDLLERKISCNYPCESESDETSNEKFSCSEIHEQIKLNQNIPLTASTSTDSDSPPLSTRDVKLAVQIEFGFSSTSSVSMPDIMFTECNGTQPENGDICCQKQGVGFVPSVFNSCGELSGHFVPSVFDSCGELTGTFGTIPSRLNNEKEHFASYTLLPQESENHDIKIMSDSDQYNCSMSLRSQQNGTYQKPLKYSTRIQLESANNSQAFDNAYIEQGPSRLMKPLNSSNKTQGTETGIQNQPASECNNGEYSRVTEYSTLKSPQDYSCPLNIQDCSDLFDTTVSSACRGEIQGTLLCEGVRSSSLKNQTGSSGVYNIEMN